MKKNNKKEEPTEQLIAAELQKIGKRMKEIRKGKGYDNYETFAYENNIPRAQYGRYERGQDLKVSSLFKVLKGFGMTWTDFFEEIK